MKKWQIVLIVVFSVVALYWGGLALLFSTIYRKADESSRSAAARNGWTEFLISPEVKDIDLSRVCGYIKVKGAWFPIHQGSCISDDALESIPSTKGFNVFSTVSGCTIYLIPHSDGCVIDGSK